MLGILAGFLIAMGGAVTNTAGHSIANVGLCRLVSGLLFPFGLAMVILTGAELFTGNTLLFLSVLNQRTSAARMLRNWGLVYLGNFAGALAVAAGCAFSGQMDYSAGGLAVFTIKAARRKVCSDLWKRRSPRPVLQCTGHPRGSPLSDRAGPHRSGARRLSAGRLFCNLWF